MQFLKSEAEGDERITLVYAGFVLSKKKMMIEIIENKGVTLMLLRIYTQPLLY